MKLTWAVQFQPVFKVLKWLLAMFAIVYFAKVATEYAVGQGWPLQPVNAEHPIANTLGEILSGDQRANYQHEGIDILAEAYPGASAPFAVVTAAGYVKWADMQEHSTTNTILIESNDGRRYTYMHLEYLSLSTALKHHFDETPNDPFDPTEPTPLASDWTKWPPMYAGDLIAMVRDAFGCGRSHLHYQIQRTKVDTTLLNPLLDIAPNPDPDAPEIAIGSLHLATAASGSWSVLLPANPPDEYTTVKGNVSIIVDAHDRDDANSGLAAATHVGIYKWEWRACATSNPDCSWSITRTYHEMPGDWSSADNASTKANFSFESPFVTSPEQWIDTSVCPVDGEDSCLGSGEVDCPVDADNATYTVLEIEPSQTPRVWKTANGKYPDGDYLLSVRASDIGGNSDVQSRKVRVDNLPN